MHIRVCCSLLVNSYERKIWKSLSGPVSCYSGGLSHLITNPNCGSHLELNMFYCSQRACLGLYLSVSFMCSLIWTWNPPLLSKDFHCLVNWHKFLIQLFSCKCKLGSCCSDVQSWKKFVLWIGFSLANPILCLHKCKRAETLKICKMHCALGLTHKF